MLTTLLTFLFFQAMYTALGNCIGLVFMGAWLVLHPAERRRLSIMWRTRAPSLEEYQQRLLHTHLSLVALDELFLWVN